MLKDIFDVELNTDFSTKRRNPARVTLPRNKNGTVLRGIVHDPLARNERRISGNAGLFSDVNDLAVLPQPFKTAVNGTKTVLSPLSR